MPAVSKFASELRIASIALISPPWTRWASYCALAGPDRLGFLYDVGHAQTLDRLGFSPHEEWLKRYASRIIGVHLHDVTGVDDHRAPGLGEVDFRMVASYLPKEAYRALEVQSFNTPEQIKAGMQILVDTGCVRLDRIRRIIDA